MTAGAHVSRSTMRVCWLEPRARTASPSSAAAGWAVHAAPAPPAAHYTWPAARALHRQEHGKRRACRGQATGNPITRSRTAAPATRTGVERHTQISLRRCATTRLPKRSRRFRRGKRLALSACAQALHKPAQILLLDFNVRGKGAPRQRFLRRGELFSRCTIKYTRSAQHAPAVLPRS